MYIGIKYAYWQACKKINFLRKCWNKIQNLFYFKLLSFFKLFKVWRPWNFDYNGRVWITDFVYFVTSFFLFFVLVIKFDRKYLTYTTLNFKLNQNYKINFKITIYFFILCIMSNIISIQNKEIMFVLLIFF